MSIGMPKMVPEEPVKNVDNPYAEDTGAKEKKGFFNSASTNKIKNIAASALSAFVMGGAILGAAQGAEAKEAPRSAERAEQQDPAVTNARKSLGETIRKIKPGLSDAQIESVLKNIDQDLQEVGLNDPNDLVKGYELVEDQFLRLDAEQKEEKVEFEVSTENFRGTYNFSFRADGTASVVLYKGQRIGGSEIVDIVYNKYLKPDFMKYYRADGNFLQDRNTIILRAETLLRNDEARAVALAQGNERVAAALEADSISMEQQIEEDFGDVLQ